MTNEEKSQKIRLDYTKGGYRETIYATDLEDALKEMAEWKDEQFNMIIEKIIDLFDKYPSNAVYSKNNVIEMFKTLKITMEE